MLYTALCISTANFVNTGTITVRIFEYYVNPRSIRDPNSGKITETGIDYLTATSQIDEGEKFGIGEKEFKGDFEALVFAPLGGGRNYGLMALPKTNEKGVVAFLDGALSKPIWLGSYFQALRQADDYKTINGVNIPNEDPDKEGSDSDGIQGGEINSGLDDSIKGDQNTIVLRTRTTNTDSDTNLDWEQVNTENLVAIDANKINIRHFSDWNQSTLNKYQDIMISGDTITIQTKDVQNDKTGMVTISHDAFSIRLFEGTEEKANVSADSSAVYINGDEDTMVLYSKLVEIIDALATHIHISSVPTGPPLDDSLAPLNPQLKQTKQQMEANKAKSKYYSS